MWLCLPPLLLLIPNHHKPPAHRELPTHIWAPGLHPRSHPHPPPKILSALLHQQQIRPGCLPPKTLPHITRTH